MHQPLAPAHGRREAVLADLPELAGPQTHRQVLGWGSHVGCISPPGTTPALSQLTVPHTLLRSVHDPPRTVRKAAYEL